MDANSRRKLGMAANAATFSRNYPNESPGYEAALSGVEKHLARAEEALAEQRSGLLGVHANAITKRETRRTIREAHLAHIAQVARTGAGRLRRSRRSLCSSRAPTHTSSSTASVQPSGATSAILTAVRRGTVTISASTDDMVEEVTLRVTAELRIQPDYVLDVPHGWPMAVGDQLQLEAVYANVDGQDIGEIPSLTWSSTNPAGVSVSPAGLVTATQANYVATVVGTASDDTIRIAIRVLDVVAGQPATVRIVHGVPGIGPVRFMLSQGVSRSLSHGQSAVLPIFSGTLRVGTEGLPPGDPLFGDPSGQFVGVVRPGDHLSLYAAGNSQGAFLQPAWPPTASIPPDSVWVRLIQSSPALVVYLRPDGAPISGLPELCYFDPGVVSDYFVRAAGDFDIIGQHKYDQQNELGRASGSVPGGHAVTMVLTGGEEQPLSVLTFTDR